MRLTNLQLDTLVKTIYKKVEEKIKSLKRSAEYPVAKKTAEKNINYKEKAALVSEIKAVQSKISKLKEEEGKLYDKGLKVFDVTSQYQVGNRAKSLESDLEEEAIRILSKDLPTKEDIQTDIVLYSVGGDGKDIVSTLTSKYGI